MLVPLEVLLVAVALVIAVAALVLALLRAPRPPWYQPALQALEAGLVVQVVLAGLSLLRGHRPEEVITFVAYALTSLIVIPILLALLSSPDEDYGGPVWPNVLVAVAGAAVAVIVIRMGVTWASVGA